MKKGRLLISAFHTGNVYFNDLSAVTHCPTNPGYIVGHLRGHFVLCRRKQDRAPDIISISKMPQAMKWLLAAFLLFDIIPHNSLSTFRELWGMMSNWLFYFYLLGRKALLIGKKKHFIKILLCCTYDFTCDSFLWHVLAAKGEISTIIPETASGYARLLFLLSMIRGPPLLKFYSKAQQNFRRK